MKTDWSSVNIVFSFLFLFFCLFFVLVFVYLANTKEEKKLTRSLNTRDLHFL